MMALYGDRNVDCAWIMCMYCDFIRDKMFILYDDFVCKECKMTIMLIVFGLC